MYEISRFNKKIHDNVKAHVVGEIIGGAGKLFGGLFGQSEQEKAAAQAAARYKAIQDLLKGVPNDYDPTLYDTSLLQPYTYDMPEELTGQTVADSPEARAYQANALKEMEQIQNEGLTTQQMADFAKARREADIQARGQSEALQQQQQAKGTATSGVSAVLDAMARQSAADRASQSMTEQAAETARQRALANAQVFAAGGQLRQGDVNLNKTNADIINEFNTQNSARTQATRNANTDLMNQAISAQRNTQNANADLKNQIAAQGIQNQINKANALAGVQGTLAKQDYAQGAAKAGQVSDIFNTLGATGAGIYGSMQEKPKSSASSDLDNLYNETNSGVSILNPKYKFDFTK